MPGRAPMLSPAAEAANRRAVAERARAGARREAERRGLARYFEGIAEAAAKRDRSPTSAQTCTDPRVTAAERLAALRRRVAARVRSSCTSAGADAGDEAVSGRAFCSNSSCTTSPGSPTTKEVEKMHFGLETRIQDEPAGGRGLDRTDVMRSPRGDATGCNGDGADDAAAAAEASRHAWESEGVSDTAAGAGVP